MEAGVEERDREVRDGHPEERRQVADRPAADPRPDPVDAEERDREEDARVQHDDRREAAEHVRAREERDRRQDDRPGVADRRSRQRPVGEHPGRRVVEGLVAALVIEPAVVVRLQGEREHGDPLDRQQRCEEDERLAAEGPEPRRRLDPAQPLAPGLGERAEVSDLHSSARASIREANARAQRGDRPSACPGRVPHSATG